jgi:micrococcal nuclease
MDLLKCSIGLLALTCFLSAPVYSETPVTVTRCIDGDTLQLSNGEKVRLIGVDTPESKNNAKTRRDAKRTGQDIKTITEQGKKAKEFTRQLVESKQVRLEQSFPKCDGSLR